MAWLHRAEELRRRPGQPRLDPLARRRRACLAEPLADEIRHLATAGAVPGYRMPRVTFHLGRWLRSTDWYPDYQLRLYDRRRARWSGRLVHESVTADGPVVDLHGEIAALRLPRPLASPADDGSLYHAGRQADVRGRAARLAGGDLALHPAGRVSSQLRAAWRLPRRRARPHHLGDERALRRPEVRQALGTVFSLHIDTARTWRGGQQQVAPDRPGDARARAPCRCSWRTRRASCTSAPPRGRISSALAPRNEIDLGAAWRLSRVIRDYRPDVVHAHDPHAVSMAADGAVVRRRHCRCRRWSRRGASTSTSVAIRSRGGSTARSRASSPHRGAIRDILVDDGIPPAQVDVVHDGIDVAKVHAPAGRSISTSSSGCRTVCR